MSACNCAAGQTHTCTLRLRQNPSLQVLQIWTESTTEKTSEEAESSGVSVICSIGEQQTDKQQSPQSLIDLSRAAEITERVLNSQSTGFESQFVE